MRFCPPPSFAPVSPFQLRQKCLYLNISKRWEVFFLESYNIVRSEWVVSSHLYYENSRHAFTLGTLQPVSNDSYYFKQSQRVHPLAVGYSLISWERLGEGGGVTVTRERVVTLHPYGHTKSKARYHKGPRLYVTLFLLDPHPHWDIL